MYNKENPIYNILFQIQSSIDLGYEIDSFILNESKFREYVHDYKIFGYDAVLSTDIECFEVKIKVQ